jgi:hypothetical protein
MMITNLFPNPRFDPNGTPIDTDWMCSTSVSDGVLAVTRQQGMADNGRQYVMTIPPGQNMVFKGNASGGRLIVFNRTWGMLNSDGFTVPTDGFLRLRFMADTNSTAMFSNPVLCTANDWQALQSLGLNRLDGNLMLLS